MSVRPLALEEAGMVSYSDFVTIETTTEGRLSTYVQKSNQMAEIEECTRFPFFAEILTIGSHFLGIFRLKIWDVIVSSALVSKG